MSRHEFRSFAVQLCVNRLDHVGIVQDGVASLVISPPLIDDRLIQTLTEPIEFGTFCLQIGQTALQLLNHTVHILHSEHDRIHALIKVVPHTATVDDLSSTVLHDPFVCIDVSDILVALHQEQLQAFRYRDNVVHYHLLLLLLLLWHFLLLLLRTSSRSR